jgi:7,8-dihydropterin-6-yl-methyl-4-(beta-D-ribofuranosyl)aminobenzene 5'-phosphate synthase
MKVLVLYDKECLDDSYACGWGVSYLIDGRILFDTGEKAEPLISNAKNLNSDLERVEKIIISHNHWDHRGGMFKLLEDRPSIKAFVTQDLYSEFLQPLTGYDVTIGGSSLKIEEGVFTSGTFSTQYKGKYLQEQALIIRTEKGISIFCGCAHPGVLEFVKKSKEIFPGEVIYSLIGGYHFIEQDNRYVRYIAEQLLKEGVQNLGPSHCTGFAAQSVLRQAYPDNFIEIKSGAKIEI